MVRRLRRLRRLRLLTTGQTNRQRPAEIIVAAQPEPVSSSIQLPVDIPLEPESDTVPDATVEVAPAAQRSWLDDDLFAA
ncbi:hypothetical protein BZM26_09650 [Paraburkholderia strydomiana]|nr:hypothetical protein BZM26_09650 [Paraburkholderia strydomiana]